jgi:hypothetical protein
MVSSRSPERTGKAETPARSNGITTFNSLLILSRRDIAGVYGGEKEPTSKKISCSILYQIPNPT